MLRRVAVVAVHGLVGTLIVAAPARAQVLDTQSYYGCVTGFPSICLSFNGTLSVGSGIFAGAIGTTGFVATNVIFPLIAAHGELTPTRWLDLQEVQTNYATPENQGDNKWDFTGNLTFGTAQFGQQGAKTAPASIGFTFRASTCQGEFFQPCPDGGVRQQEGAFDLTVFAAPEPATWALLATGLAGLAGARALRRRQRVHTTRIRSIEVAANAATS